LSKFLIISILFLEFILVKLSLADESPDELYKQGRFAEAEEVYAALDMDHPKDIRYRYNRGCAAYQNSEYQGAMAASLSVLRRAKDDEMRFKAAFNLGNVAYKQIDFKSAVNYYRQSILYNPESEDAQYNLELALIKLKKQKKEKTKEEKKQPEKASDNKTTQTNDQKHDKGQKESKQDEKSKQESPKDLTGELKPLKDSPQKEGEEQSPDSAMSMIDKKKAEALLDNIKEDRSRFLRFQIPEEKKHGAKSGKDW